MKDDMTDIVERAREYVSLSLNEYGQNDLLTEMADEIEKLREDNARQLGYATHRHLRHQNLIRSAK